MASDRLVHGTLTTVMAETVQLFDTQVNGASRIGWTTIDVTIAGSNFHGKLTLAENNQVSVNEVFGDYGPILAGSTVTAALDCRDNSSGVADFGATRCPSVPRRSGGRQGGPRSTVPSRPLW